MNQFCHSMYSISSKFDNTTNERHIQYTYIDGKFVWRNLLIWNTDFWFASRNLWIFSKKYAAFLDFALSCIYCLRIFQVHEQKIRDFFLRKSAIFSKMLINSTSLLDGSTTHVSCQIIFVYSDGKNLKCNIYENAAYFFDNFHRIREANQKSVTKSTGIKTSGFFTRSGRRRFPSYTPFILWCKATQFEGWMVDN